MAITAMSRALKCAREGALSASSLAVEGCRPAARVVGTIPNMSHLRGGDFARDAGGRSPLSKWVYCVTCQGPRTRVHKNFSDPCRGPGVAARFIGRRPGKRLPGEV